MVRVLKTQSVQAIGYIIWVSYPCVLKALIYKGFQLSHSFALDINTTHST